MRTQRIFFCIATSFVLALAFSSLAGAQEEVGEGKLDRAEPKGTTPQKIIERFAAREQQFKLARERYTFRQEVKVETLDGDTVDGEYRMVSDILFNDKGKRMEQVVFAPQSTLTSISLTKEDLDDFQNHLPFVLTSDEIPEYSILYVGQQQEDELQTYVFDIAPKQIGKGKRYFQGRIWVDNQDFQIVKTQGMTVPQIRGGRKQENLFPKFTTWRQQVDGQYWFPVYTRADDILHFKTGDVHIRETLKYTDYKRFGSSVKVTYQGQEVEKVPDKEQPQPPPQPEGSPRP
jgi:hypothetical protein